MVIFKMCYKDKVIYEILIECEKKLRITPYTKEILKKILYNNLEYFFLELINPNELYVKLHKKGIHEDQDKISALLNVPIWIKECKKENPDLIGINKN